MNHLIAKNGQSEWQFEGKTLIAVPEEKNNPCCLGCFFDAPYCLSKQRIGVFCTDDFPNNRPDVIFIEKTAEK